MRFCVVAFARRRHRPKEEEEEENDDDGDGGGTPCTKKSQREDDIIAKQVIQEKVTIQRVLSTPPSQSTHLGFLGFRRKK